MVPRSTSKENKMENKPFRLGQNLTAAIFFETPIIQLDWVKKLGQWHLSGGNGQTICGKPMLGNNYAKYIPENERTKCVKCFEGN